MSVSVGLVVVVRLSVTVYTTTSVILNLAFELAGNVEPNYMKFFSKTLGYIHVIKKKSGFKKVEDNFFLTFFLMNKNFLITTKKVILIFSFSYFFWMKNIDSFD